MATGTKRIPTLGERLRNYRFENDLTQEKLAQLLGVSIFIVSRAENGGEISDRTQFKIKKLIGETPR
jgi:transcriptional regulator with XRE-family HTH domain